MASSFVELACGVETRFVVEEYEENYNLKPHIEKEIKYTKIIKNV